MSFLAFFVFLAPVLTGILILHFIWPDRNAAAVFLKVCLGVGFGLGLNSLIRFVSLLLSINPQAVFLAQLAILVLLFDMALARAGRRPFVSVQVITLSPVQRLLAAGVLIALAFSALALRNLSNARPQGTYDAWSIWNRIARFIYRDPENWRAAASPELYWATHPDYPWLVPLNVVWGWERLNTESARIPQMQSALFSFAMVGLLFASLCMIRTIGQASLASLILLSTPTLLQTAYEQIADIPLSFFILSSCVLIFFYFKFDKPVFLVLSGFAAGLAAWTKNEGLLFTVVSCLGLLLATRREIRQRLFFYLLGLAVPLCIVLYFKWALAPPSDLFSAAQVSLTSKVADIPRYGQVVAALFEELSHYAGWPINIFIPLAIYAVVMRLDLTPDSRRATLTILGVMLLQGLGYFAILVLTPHDLAWQLTYALDRLIFHVYPTGIFLYFATVTEPEKGFAGKSKSTASD